MKAKKARKRLQQVEGLLAGILERDSNDEHGVQELLLQARAAVLTAVTTLDNGAAKQPPVSTVILAKTRPAKSRLSAAGRKSLSLAAKKRWAAAKRKGVHAVTGRPLRKTA